ncbi:MAG: hypothetical protein RSB25_16400 [Acinetobacter sp.]
MDFNMVGTAAGVVIAAIGLFLPHWLSTRTDRRKDFRAAAAHMQEKLLAEMKCISGGSYSFRSITEKDLFKLLPHASNRHQKLLIKAFDLYVHAHEQTAKTKPWEDGNQSSPIFFPMGFTITNPTDTLKEMQPLLRELRR